jgi:hypothetical protein
MHVIMVGTTSLVVDFVAKPKRNAKNGKFGVEFFQKVNMDESNGATLGGPAVMLEGELLPCVVFRYQGNG